MKKRLNKTHIKINSRVHIGRFDNLPVFYFGPKMLVIKKKAFCSEIIGKWLIIQGARKNYFPTSSTFLALFEGPAEKLMAHSQISFKSWLNNVDSELYTYFFQCSGGLKK